MAPPRIRGLLASVQQWMIGVGIMIAVSNPLSYTSTFSNRISSNGSDTAVHNAQANLPGGSLYHCKQRPPLFSLVAFGFCPSHRAG
jgi:hypothetical protein